MENTSAFFCLHTPHPQNLEKPLYFKGYRM
ncbi:hypothetical protein CPC197_0791A, partial [Chlamydia psittaci C1/97]